MCPLNVYSESVYSLRDHDLSVTISGRSRITYKQDEDEDEDENLELVDDLSPEAVSRFESVVKSYEEHPMALEGDPFSEGKNTMYDAYPVEQFMPVAQVNEYVARQ